MVRFISLKGFYEIDRTIGCGGFAKVKLATHLATGEKVAIKIMDKALLKADLARVKLEIAALKSVSHENICKLFEVIETDTHMFLVMEYCSGGELFDHIVEKNRLTETESRIFFRQIVSAVAYLHSLGYAHRDLKPENILLDGNQKLKLIDFGLCAKPEGGMEDPLFTSCGSPTYAAPELVQGKQYLGSEVDVWAMGVLLYTLLVGALPFDDLNIDSLYKKILAGKYEEPNFLSSDSIRLIKSMLQVDPKKRITIRSLISHPWLTLGILKPVEVVCQNSKGYQRDCVEFMARHYQVENRTMWQHLKKWKYDYHTATYLLLLSKRKRGSSLKLNDLTRKASIDIDKESTFKKRPVLRSINSPSVVENSHKPMNLQNTNISNILTRLEKGAGNIRNTATPNGTPNKSTNNFIEPQKPASLRKTYKRIRSPGPDDSSPVPAKRISTEPSTPVRTPDRKISSVSSDTPGSARRVLGSIERSFQKVVNVLTPRKIEESYNVRPPVLSCKELFNVSTTQCKDPEFVMAELTKALEKKGVTCKRKGFTLRGKLEPTCKQNFGECSFELEICYLPDLGHSEPQSELSTPTKFISKKNVNNTPIQNQTNGFVGIRRKRLRGDSWCYKKVCEEVLALTSKEFVGFSESSV